VPRSQSFVKRGVLAGALLAATCALVTTPAGAYPLRHGHAGGSRSSPHLPIGTFLDGVAAELTAWWTLPPGSSNWSCRPSRAHPYPVVLVHGTFASAAFSWQALSPMLVDAGYCVFALDYGQTVPGPFYGTGQVESSASVLAAFVQKILRATGAARVDIVGHSQGGLMPRYYIDFLGGARYVHMLVGLSPSNHGTTALGLSTLVTELELLGFPSLSNLGCPACDEQLQGSAFLQKTNGAGDTVPGPRYVVIETALDEIVTPYQSAFLNGPAVQNILVQSQCFDDLSDHLGMLYDPNVMQDVMNALGPDSPNFQPSCVPTLPVVG
jgi:triacylglycerol esterase/lipase EstA (alpha/beta hydrolase family)